jgi:Arm DNA-binding domain
MAGGTQKFTARAAANTKPGRYGDGAGLYLVVSPSGARKWVYRFSYAGKVTEAGLGSADLVSLAEARDKAHEARTLSTRRHEAGRPEVWRTVFAFDHDECCGFITLLRKATGHDPIGRAFLQ